MKPTSVGLLAAVAVLVGAVVYAVLRTFYGDLPPVPLYAPATLLFLGVAEFLGAGSVRARLQGRSGTRPIDPIAVARLVALAKASAVAGSIAVGGYAALLGYTLHGVATPSKHHDAAASGFGVFAGLLLVVAALQLERSGRAPDQPPDEPPDHDRFDPVADWHRDDRPQR